MLFGGETRFKFYNQKHNSTKKAYRDNGVSCRNRWIYHTDQQIKHKMNEQA